MSPEHVLEPTGTCGMAHSIRLVLWGRGGKLMGEARLMSTVNRLGGRARGSPALDQSAHPGGHPRDDCPRTLSTGPTISSGKAAELLGMPRVNRLQLLASSFMLNPMQITVDLPDDIAGHADPGREALEALAIEGYRCGKLTHYQASQLLGMTRFEFDGFLKDRHIYDHAYGVEDLEQDLETLRRLEARGLLRR
jgi:predicted HTH domain antitoxin